LIPHKKVLGSIRSPKSDEWCLRLLLSAPRTITLGGKKKPGTLAG
jgi:hypothetical protein